MRDGIIAAVLVAGFVAYPLLSSGFQPTTPISKHQLSVTDGDTIRLNGAARGIRLVGFNAPETFNPRCGQEKALGDRATARLKQLVAASDLELIEVDCACEPGTAGTDACNYGRSCARLRADGRDVGNILISEGLAVRFACHGTGCPPTPRPWCG